MSITTTKSLIALTLIFMLFGVLFFSKFGFYSYQFLLLVAFYLFYICPKIVGVEYVFNETSFEKRRFNKLQFSYAYSEIEYLNVWFDEMGYYGFNVIIKNRKWPIGFPLLLNKQRGLAKDWLIGKMTACGNENIGKNSPYMKRFLAIERLFFPIFFVVVGVTLLMVHVTDTYIAPEPPPPAYETLIKYEGKIDWVKSDKDSVRFGLKNDLATFIYLPTSGAMQQVKEHLNGSMHRLVTLFVAPVTLDIDERAKQKLYKVFELKVDGHDVRTYRQTTNAVVKRSEKLYLYLSVIFIVSGFYFGKRSGGKKEA